jgi:hypothetical protein
MTEDRWVIRNVEEADRETAVAAAKRAGMTTAEWLGLAIREKLARERTLGELEGEVIDLFDASEPARDPEDLHQDHHMVLIEPMAPPTVAEIGCAVDVAEKIARLRGRKLSPRIAARASELLLRRLTLPAPSD